MRYIDKLLQGREVLWKPLGEVAKIEKGQRVTKRELLPVGKYPVYSGGISPMGFYNEANKPAGTVTVVKYGSAGFVNFIEEEFWANDVCYCIKPNSCLLTKFVYYILKNSEYKIQALRIDAIPAHLPTAAINSFLVPIPPLDVQEEIVRILDKFTTLEAELEAELEARTKQYRYYLNHLLTFDPTQAPYIDQLLQGREVLWKPLGEVLDYEQSSIYIVKSTNYSNEYKTPVLTAGKSFILGYTNETEGIYKASKKDPVIIFDDFTTSYHWVDFDFKVKSSAMKMIKLKKTETLSFKYLYYAFSTIKYKPMDHTRQWISIYSHFVIPIPPLDVQEEIVRILDRFETLTTSLQEGLPREIALRRKQYTYYRDQLLTFPTQEA